VCDNLGEGVVALLNVLEVGLHTLVHVVAVVVADEGLHGSHELQVLSDAEIGGKHL